MNEHHRLAEQLEGVLAGTVDLLALLDDALSYGEPMKGCYHGLWHYQMDADIRARGPRISLNAGYRDEKAHRTAAERSARIKTELREFSGRI